MRDKQEAEALVARWRDLGGRIRIGGPMPTRFEFCPHEEHGFCRRDLVRVSVVVTVTDSRSGAASAVTHEGRVAWGEPDPRQLRELAAQAWLHELDEFFLLDGRVIFDPHEGEDELGRRRPARGQA